MGAPPAAPTCGCCNRGCTAAAERRRWRSAPSSAAVTGTRPCSCTAHCRARCTPMRARSATNVCCACKAQQRRACSATQTGRPRGGNGLMYWSSTQKGAAQGHTLARSASSTGPSVSVLLLHSKRRPRPWLAVAGVSASAQLSAQRRAELCCIHVARSVTQPFARLRAVGVGKGASMAGLQAAGLGQPGWPAAWLAGWLAAASWPAGCCGCAEQCLRGGSGTAAKDGGWRR